MVTDASTTATEESLLDFASDVLGPIAEFEDRSRKFGRKSVTWRVTAKNGDVFYVKKHEEHRLFETELVVYTKWVPHLEPSTEWNMSELVRHSHELGAMVLTEVPGQIVDETDSSRQDLIAIYRAAGGLASQIHQLDVDALESGPSRIYDEPVWNRFLRLGTPYLDEETIGWISGVVSDPGMFDGLAVVPTHADFSPRNWLIHRSKGQVSLGLIDWERARAGYWLEDVQRLAFDYWLTHPELRTAYFDGYGRVPTLAEERQLQLIALANALGTVSWAIEHRDFEFAEFGRRTLRLLRDRLS